MLLSPAACVDGRPMPMLKAAKKVFKSADNIFRTLLWIWFREWCRLWRSLFRVELETVKGKKIEKEAKVHKQS